ncbi:MAG: hypothetical protein SGJ20_06665 [Planctomycetota bacterium]|nr:hypothetical protein [Planctomycetota bacterium]
MTAKLVAKRYLSAAAAVHHPFRNIPARSIGAAEEVDSDIQTLDLISDDRLILATDRLTKDLEPDAFISVLLHSDIKDADGMCQSAAPQYTQADAVTTVVTQILEVRYE